jgi:hypothetical protein
MGELVRVGLMGFSERDREQFEAWSEPRGVFVTPFPIEAELSAPELSALAALLIATEERPLLSVGQCGRAHAVAPELPVALLGPRDLELEAAARRAGAGCVLSRSECGVFPWQTLNLFLRHGPNSRVTDEPITLSDGVTLDRLGRRLLIDGHDHPLSATKFELLCYLIDHAGRAVSARELVSMRLLLPSQATRYRCIIFELRDHLGSARHLICAVPGYGYRMDLPRERD